MNDPLPRFPEITAEPPDYDLLAADYDAILDDLGRATTNAGRIEAVERWDALRRRISTWRSLTHLQFNRETDKPERKAARELCDELTPRITDLDVKIKKRLLGHPARAALEDHFGAHAFALWETDISTFDPKIEDDLATESKLEAEYVELLASARIEFQGETLNLSGLGRYTSDRDRDVRRGAEEARWGWFAAHGDELDRIYDELVALRTKMAHTLGYPSYTELGYRRMQRTDYDQRDVARFRDEVRTEVVPLARELRRAQATRIGLDPLMYWDESVHDPEGNPAPQGDYDWIMSRAARMFDALGGELAEFFALMRDHELLDLQTREGKAGGGFCTSFPSYGLPYIFANFNGTKGDVEVFTHELGHAFQNWKTREAGLFDYLWPTAEACEIHSMGLEFLTWPQMEQFFEDRAAAYRRIHLTDRLLFLPYGVAIDEFQHRVYAEPDATPRERHAIWKEIEGTYLPWRDFGHLDYPARGAFWQLQRHIYIVPFYYIDYTLALACAFQIWVRAQKNRPETMATYIDLCRLGGRRPFQALVASAGLTSPFSPGCLTEAVGQARAFLESHSAGTES